MRRFDMSALVKCDKLDTLGALKGFPNRQDLWVALTAVVTEAHRYLRDYTPSVILYNGEVKEDFFKEVQQTRDLLGSLRIHRAPDLLDNLLDAVARMDDHSLSDGLAVFYAEMDLLQKALSKTMIVEDEVSVKQAGKPIIMAVDDMPEILASITEMLIGQYRVIALNNGRSALKALENQTPTLFLLDIEMPGMTGYDLAKKIRSDQRFKTTPILFFTSHGTREHVRAAMQHGGTDYLLKPLSQTELLGKLKQYIP